MFSTKLAHTQTHPLPGAAHAHLELSSPLTRLLHGSPTPTTQLHPPSPLLPPLVSPLGGAGSRQEAVRLQRLTSARLHQLTALSSTVHRRFRNPTLQLAREILTQVGEHWRRKGVRRLPSNSPHDHMILRVDLVDSHGRWKRACLQGYQMMADERAGGDVPTEALFEYLVANLNVAEQVAEEAIRQVDPSGRGAVTHEQFFALFDDELTQLDDAADDVGDDESSLGDAKSPLGDAKSSLGDAESSLGGR
jgi:hypothetical protein